MKFNKDIFLVVLPVYLLALYFYQEFNIWFSLFGFFFIGCICDEIIVLFSDALKCIKYTPLATSDAFHFIV